MSQSYENFILIVIEVGVYTVTMTIYKVYK